jgi:ubiquinone/menaquinone biosynthesis C-methylase UbiE
MPNPITPNPASAVDRLPTREGYDRWAACYDAEDNPLIAVEEPKVAELLGPVSGLRILDLGCGTGRHALRLAAAGANVTAVDFSEGMLAQARRRAGTLPIDFRAHDLTQPLPFADASFDRIICGLVLDHIPKLKPLFAEMRRVCSPTGFAMISVMHPAMMLRGVEARFTDRTTGREIRPASTRHQLTDYINAVLAAGWTLEHASEHEVDEALAARSERARKYADWLMLLVMRLTRP